MLSASDDMVKEGMAFVFRFAFAIVSVLVKTCCNALLGFCSSGNSRLKLVVEPAAGTGVGALLNGQVHISILRTLSFDCVALTALPSTLKNHSYTLKASRMGDADAIQRIGVVLCGGNVDLETWLPHLLPPSS